MIALILLVILTGLLVYHSFVYLPYLTKRVARLESAIFPTGGKHHL